MLREGAAQPSRNASGGAQLNPLGAPRFSQTTSAIPIRAGASLVGGLCIAITVHNIEWFARSGAIVSVLEIALISQVALLAETVRTEAVHPEGGLSSADPTNCEPPIKRSRFGGA